MADDAGERADKFAHAFLVASELEDLRSYLERGRHLETLPIAELEFRWLKAGNAFFRDDDKSQVRPFKDLGAEYRLRSLEPPHCQLAAAIDKATERLMRYRKENLERLHRHLGAFLDELKQAKN